MSTTKLQIKGQDGNFTPASKGELVRLATSARLMYLHMHLADRDPLFQAAHVVFADPRHPEPRKAMCVLRLVDLFTLPNKFLLELNIFGCTLSRLEKARVDICHAFFDGHIPRLPSNQRDMLFHITDLERMLGVESVTHWLYRDPTCEPEELAAKIHASDLSTLRPVEAGILLTRRLCEHGFRKFSNVDGQEHWLRFAVTGDDAKDEENIRMLANLPVTFDDFEEENKPDVTVIHVRFPILSPL